MLLFTSQMPRATDVQKWPVSCILQGICFVSNKTNANFSEISTFILRPFKLYNGALHSARFCFATN
jgi:hypothetical protein